MKVAEAKPVSSSARAHTSFFSKGADSSFFEGRVSCKPFFSKSSDQHSTIQTKLNIGNSNDRYEREADKTADHVVNRLGSPKTSTKNQPSRAENTISELPQRKCSHCEEESHLQRMQQNEDQLTEKKQVEQGKVRKKIQEDEKIRLRNIALADRRRNIRRRANEEDALNNQQHEHSNINRKVEDKEKENRFSSIQVQKKSTCCSEKDDHIQRKGESTQGSWFENLHSLEANLLASRGGGQALPKELLKQMEQSFGVDFSQIRIHHNALAESMCTQLNAQAFAYGNNIYFNTGKYNPDTSAGLHLLAHELTHTVQQVAAKPLSKKQQEQVFQNPISTLYAQTEPKIAKDEEEDDSMLMNAAKDAVWALLREASPEIHDIFRYQGFANWAEGKIGSFVSKTINEFTAPIRVGAEIIESLKTNFNLFKIWMASAIERLKQGDCSPFEEATQFITDILEGLSGPILEKVKEFLRPIKEFIDMVWNDFAKPIWEFVSTIFGEIWDAIKWVADKIWNYFKRYWDELVTVWHWFATAIGFEGDDQNSLWEQIKRKVLQLWEKIKAKLEPYKSKLMILGGILLMLSPAGPFLLAAAAVGGILYLASRIRHYLRDKDAIIRERGIVNGIIIPKLIESLNSLKGILKEKAQFIIGALTQAVQTLQSISQDLGDIALDALNSIVSWLNSKIETLSVWAETQLNSLVNNLELVVNRIIKFVQPITRILHKVGLAMTNYINLAFLILDDMFHRIPECIRERIIAFLIKYVFKHIPLLREIEDIGAAWNAIRAKTMQILNKLFVQGDVKGALWDVFNLLIVALKFPKDLAVKVLNQCLDVFESIIDQPKVFFINMLTTVKLGFIGFFERKWEHLKAGFSNWLMKATKDSQIYIPKAFSFAEIFKMLGSIFSVGMEKVYKSIEKKRGKPLADKVRKYVGMLSRGASKAWEWVVALHEHSLDEIIEMIKAKGHELLQLAIDSIIDWLVSNIITKVTAKLLSMLDPSGVMAVVNSIIAFYNAVETAIEKAQEILELVENVLNNISDVMAGALSSAARIFENNLERAIPLFLEFLANQISMGKIGKKIKEMVEKAEKWIDEKIDWLVDKLLEAADWLVDKAKKAVDKILGWLGLRKEFAVDDEKHAIYFKGSEEDAKLMVASEEMTIESLFKKKDKEIEEESNKTKKKEKQNALISAKEIYKKIESLKSKIKKKKESEEKGRMEAEMNQFFNEIVPYLIIIGVSLLDEGDLPVTQIANYPVDANRAGKVVAEPLSAKEGEPKGTEPDDSVLIAGWDDHIATIVDYSKYYVRLHLISQRLNGTGKHFWNLTPGRKNENLNMYQMAETKAIKLKEDKKVIWYEAEIGSYRSREGFTNFANDIRVRYGLMEKDNKTKKWKRIDQASYNNSFGVSEPGEIGVPLDVPTLDLMTASYWTKIVNHPLLKTVRGMAPTKDSFSDIVKGKQFMPNKTFKDWNTFTSSDVFVQAENKQPGLKAWFAKAIQVKLLRI